MLKQLWINIDKPRKLFVKINIESKSCLFEILSSKFLCLLNRYKKPISICTLKLFHDSIKVPLCRLQLGLYSSQKPILHQLSYFFNIFFPFFYILRFAFFSFNKSVKTSILNLKELI